MNIDKFENVFYNAIFFTALLFVDNNRINIMFSTGSFEFLRKFTIDNYCVDFSG
jgi:hypothetical protein